MERHGSTPSCVLSPFGRRERCSGRVSRGAEAARDRWETRAGAPAMPSDAGLGTQHSPSQRLQGVTCRLGVSQCPQTVKE